MPAGRYQLQVERRSIGAGGAQVELLGEPQVVSVGAGELQAVALP